MAEFKVKTRGGASPQGKPRVYFTAHPDDFDKYFDKICEDVFKTHDCAIYYTADMSEAFDETNMDVDLGRMNLYLVPVTFRLMSEDNRAMTVDIAYAKENNIPILPFMMESGIDHLYSLPNNFGERQYLSPFKTDSTEISYEEKLKKVLESILISDEMARRVRAAFEAYIFLSYRKKDRALANELMRVIHNIPGCRDIAIWYDEFLTPGESFVENIKQAMEKSELFTMLVTPSLLEDGNFVITEEYPAAKKSGMNILPTEMEKTDHNELAAKFDGIPEAIRPDDSRFPESLLASIKKIAIRENDSDPEHNFLIGLAYLDGIDVETDAKRGLELITLAAESGLPEAMKKLYNMYTNGENVKLDYNEALKWAKRLVDHYTEKYGEEHAEALNSLNKLWMAYKNVGDYRNAIRLSERIYESIRKIFGEENIETLAAHSNLASDYIDLGEYVKALELGVRAYRLRCKILGEEHPDTLNSLVSLSVVCSGLGEYQQALALKTKAYELYCRICGDEHPNTLGALNNIACAYKDLGEYVKALELGVRAYKLRCKILGEEHPDTLTSLNNIACYCSSLGENEKALSLSKMSYNSRCKVLGEEHPDTLNSLSILASVYDGLGERERSVELNERLYEIRCKVLGEKHPDTLITLNNLAFAYYYVGKEQKAYDMFRKAYFMMCDVFGADHPTTIQVKENMDYLENRLMW